MRVVLRLAATALLAALLTTGSAAASSGTLVKTNCAPSAAAADGTMVWYAMTGTGVDDAYIGNGQCAGTPLLPAYTGNRGPSDITRDGRYVLLTTAVGADRTTELSQPGKGSSNAIQLYDRQTHRLSTLLPSGTTSQRGVIWPKFNAADTQIAWAQMVRTPSQAHNIWGDWDLHVADVDLATGTLSHNRAWHDPAGGAAIIEAYGWIPGTHRIIFQSTTRPTSSGLKAAQLWTLPDGFTATTAPTRISPKYVGESSWSTPTDAFHEFAHFVPGDPNTLYTSIAADTVGGDDLFAYDLRTQQPNGLLGQPRRVTYFGGDLDGGLGGMAVPGFPPPRYAVVTSMAWTGGAWMAAICPDTYCSKVDAYRVVDTGS